MSDLIQYTHCSVVIVTEKQGILKPGSLVHYAWMNLGNGTCVNIKRSCGQHCRLGEFTNKTLLFTSLDLQGPYLLNWVCCWGLIKLLE